MKSDVSNELANISSCESKLSIKLDKKEQFYLPYEDSLRTLLKFNKFKETNKMYPRKFSEMKKKPL